MMKKLMLAMLMAMTINGCQQNEMEPEGINPEIDVCEVCNMGIAHEHFATEIVTVDGDVHKFDDLGCMEEFLAENTSFNEADEAKKYVRDMESGEWVELENAYYVFHPELWTPMANGVVSFKNKERAVKYAEEQGMGEIFDYNGLKKHEWSWEK